MSYEESYHTAVHADQLDERVYARQAALHARLYLGAVRSTDAVFEYGAGMGVNLFAVNAATKLGYDISEYALGFCRGKGLSVTNRLEEVPRGAWDWVLARHSLEHVPDPASVLRDLGPLLKPEGRLVIVLPQEPWRTPARLDAMDVNQHLFSWTPQTIVNLLIAGGFKVESLARVPMSMRSFLLRRGLAPGGAFDALMFLSDRLRLGTCPGEMVVTARRVGPRSASFP